MKPSKLKSLIVENVLTLFEAKELIITKSDFEVMYPKNSRDIWLIPKKGKPTHTMQNYIKRLKGIGIQISGVEDADHGSVRISLQSKILHPEEVL